MNHIPHFHPGLIIGRFQPFHLGHLYLFREALKQVDQVIVGIGGVNVHDADNPFSQKEIETTINNVIHSEKWDARVIQMFGIPDIHNDEKWRNFIEKYSTPFDVVVSHNDWVTRIFKKVGIPVIEIPFFKRDIYEGAKIRELMRSGGEWKNRVPQIV